MNDSVSAIRIRALSIEAGQAVNAPSQSQGAEVVPSEKRFDAFLDRAVQGARSLTFSAHAQNRLVGRGIELTDVDKAKLGQGLERANAKGARDALLVMNGKGFIANVKSRTVLTALDMTELNSKVVTNIDSAVFL